MRTVLHGVVISGPAAVFTSFLGPPSAASSLVFQAGLRTASAANGMFPALSASHCRTGGTEEGLPECRPGWPRLKGPEES